MITAVPRLLAITPPDFDPDRLRALLPQLHGIVDAVQFRFPHLSASRIFDLALDLARLPQRPAIHLSDRCDIAAATQLDGVQLRESSLPPSRLLDSMRPPLVGVSRHDPKASADGADFLIAAPVYSPSSKPHAIPLGLGGLRAFVETCSVPVLGLGGIEPADVSDVLKAGAHGIAVMSGILGSSDPIAGARRYGRALQESS